jgi:hypothetical protein
MGCALTPLLAHPSWNIQPWWARQAQPLGHGHCSCSPLGTCNGLRAKSIQLVSATGCAQSIGHFDGVKQATSADTFQLVHFLSGSGAGLPVTLMPILQIFLQAT